MGNPNPSRRGLKPPWKKGDPSPNPGGRPKKRPFTDNYADVAERRAPAAIITKYNSIFKCGTCHGDGSVGNKKPKKCPKCKGTRFERLLRDDATWSEVQAVAMAVEGATKRNIAAIREQRESLEGKAPQRVEISTPMDRTFDIRVIYEQAIAGRKK